MNPQYPLRRFFMLSAIVVAGAVCIPVAQAADYNQNSAETLTGDVLFDNVRIGSGGGNASTIVDATGTDSWTSNGSVFYVGAGGTGATHIGTLNLGFDNTITANQMTIGGNQPDSNSNGGHVGSVTTLANGVTTINAANMAIGTGKGTGTFTLGSDATLNLYGLTGSGSRAALIAGRMDGFNARGNTGTMNLSGGIANLHLSELALGRATAGFGSGATSFVTGSMTIGTNASNHLNVSGAGSVVQIGHNGWDTVGTNHTLTSNGTLTIGNLDAASSITSTDDSTAILIGFRSPFQQRANGTLNMNGGTLTINTAGAAIAGAADVGGTGAANSSSTLNLSGGATLVAGASSSDWIHSLTTATIGTGGATIDTNGYDLGISQGFSGAGGLTKDGAGTLTLSGSNTYNGSTLVSGGTLLLGATGSIDDSPLITVGSGATLDVSAQAGGWTVNSDQTLAGSGTVVGNVIIEGTHSPGSSPGVLTHEGDLSYTTGSNVVWELTGNTTAGRGTNFDGINVVDGVLDFTGPTTLDLVFNFDDPSIPLTSTVDWFDPFWSNNYFGTDGWLLYQVTGGSISNFGNLSIGSVDWLDGNGGFFNDAPWGKNFGLHLEGNNIYLTYTPEPSKSVLLALGLIGLLARRRR